MNVKKWAGIGIAAFVIFLVISQPNQSAGWVHDILDWLKWSAGQVVHFVAGVFSGR